MSVHYTDLQVFLNSGLLLNYGYPESSYIWRKVIPRFAHEYLALRLIYFYFQRPGFGLSTVCPNGTDERTNAGAIIDLVAAIYGPGKSVILAGLDCGARSMHRAAMDIGQGSFPQIDPLTIFIANTVPIFEEYKSFSNPNHPTTRTSLWLIGSGNLVVFINEGGSRINDTAAALFHADRALEVYLKFFDQLSVTNALVYDCQTGATIDYLEEVADQGAGLRIKMPTNI